MKVIFPHYAGDTALLLKHLTWIEELEELNGRKLGYHAILASDNKTDSREVMVKAQSIFGRVGVIRYDKAYHNGKLMTQWPWQQNNAFVHVCRAMYKQNEAWFWCETDCTALKKGWLQALENEYNAGRKPFGGHWNEQMKIFNGVAVYPANVARWCPKALMAALIVQESRNNYQPPWDAYMSPHVIPMLHKMNNIMQHLWSLPDAPDRSPTFPTQDSVTKWIRPEAVIFHRCKDGTLIDRLRERVAGIQNCVGKDEVHPRIEPILTPEIPPLPNPVIPTDLPIALPPVPVVIPAATPPPQPVPQTVPEVLPVKRTRNRKRIPTRSNWTPVR